ncbi:MAG: 3-hydroxyacyl-CoA dehydrogenase [Alphaproteobacteria bacterium]|nr:3-hydroxyacyl-CoA dehydrogenase [Alphaproteobacteria bacterium]
MRLAGHHALITGGGTGIGAAIARALAAEGARLSLVGRRKEKLEETAALLCVPAKAGTQPGLLLSQEHIFLAPADVTDRDQVFQAFAAAREAQGPVTILVNNAGTALSAPFAKVTPEAWRETLAVNLDALLHCCQAALPDLLAAEAGRIVTVASTAGLKGYAYSAPYVAAKHGAVGLTRALAAELAKTKVTVNAVCPGFTDTQMVAAAVAKISGKTGRSAEEARAQLAGFNPQGRLIAPEEVAAAVLWLCLPESGSINGQAIAVAGGEVV